MFSYNTWADREWKALKAERQQRLYKTKNAFIYDSCGVKTFYECDWRWKVYTRLAFITFFWSLIVSVVAKNKVQFME